MVQTTAATEEELGEHAYWLDDRYVAEWVESNRATGSDGSKGKGKEKAEGPQSSSSKKRSKSSKSGSAPGTSQGQSADEEYQVDPKTGTLFRFDAGGMVVYLDSSTQREYFVDEDGQSVWL